MSAQFERQVFFSRIGVFGEVAFNISAEDNAFAFEFCQLVAVDLLRLHDSSMVEPDIHCINFLSDGSMETFRFTFGEEQGAPLLLAENVGEYLYEPNAAILKAGAFKQTAVRMGKKVILNPAPAQPLSDKLLGCLYMIIPNETEAEMLTGINVTDLASMNAAEQCFARKGVKNTVITLGSKGSYAGSNIHEAAC